MSDLLALIGAAVSVANTVELLVKTISTLHTLQSRRKEANFTVIKLIAHLTALKTAFSKLKEWTNTNISEPNHQLVVDLEVAVTCCRMLVRRIDSEVEVLRHESRIGVDGTKNKSKLLNKNGASEGLQKMLDRQTSVSNLLLTICNCQVISEQKSLLERPSTRKIFEGVKDDTLWLYGELDPTSFYSRCRDTQSSVSKTFDVVRDLFISTLFEKVLQRSLKGIVEKMRREHQQPCVMTTREEKIKNKLVELELEENAKQMKKECKVLLFGDLDCQQTFLKSMKIVHSGGFTHEEREKYKEVVVRNLIRVMNSMARVIRYENVDFDDTAKMHAKILLEEIEKTQKGNQKLTCEGAGAVLGLWQDKNFMERVLNYYISIPHSFSYLVEDIHRISSDNYLPTDADILNLGRERLAGLGVQQYTFEMESHSLFMFDINSVRNTERRKWIHQFDDSLSVIFFVDLSEYDQVLCEDSTQNMLMNAIYTFEGVVNSRWFFRSSVVLLLCNISHFKEKLRSNPLGNYFLDYNGGDDVNGALKYLLGRFTQVNRVPLTLYPLFCEASDVSNLDFVWSAVKETNASYWIRRLMPPPPISGSRS